MGSSGRDPTVRRWRSRRQGAWCAANIIRADQPLPRRRRHPPHALPPHARPASPSAAKKPSASSRKPSAAAPLGRGRYNTWGAQNGGPMDVKEAVRTAKEYLAEIFADEGIANVGLEEVVFNDAAKPGALRLVSLGPGIRRGPWPLRYLRDALTVPIRFSASMPRAARSNRSPTGT